MAVANSQPVHHPMTRVKIDLGSGQKVGIVWQIGSYSGWGVLGLHMARHMMAAGDLEPMPIYPLSSVDRSAVDPVFFERLTANANVIAAAVASRPNPSVMVRGSFPMLHGLGNGLTPAPVAATFSGTPDLAIAFLEDTNLGPEAVARGQRYACIAAGASWTARVLRGAGLERVEVCPQGVDTTVFHPGPPRAHARDRFIVYSGGKLEFRKGQDVVVAAFRRFHQRHPDALLVAGWFSPWPTLARSMSDSPHLAESPGLDEKGAVDVVGWLHRNGLPEGSFQVAPAVSNRAMGRVLRQADAALFPNRCEGGTNLVAMEAIACGIPTILSANTGHLDLIADLPCLALRAQAPVPSRPDGMGTEGWGESSIDEIVEALEHVYANRDAARVQAAQAAERMRTEWSWDVQISRMLKGLGLRAE
jgi:glycosyltransferase involved in cell wall biosynthesis